MLNKPNCWIFAVVTTLAVALSLLLLSPAQVSAAPVSDSGSNSCLACHEDLYYLHDMGKNYCLTEHADRCVNCHQGNPATIDERASHKGLITHPQQNDGQKCGECHQQDVEAHLKTFAFMAGYEPVTQGSVYVPAAETTSGFPPVSEQTTLSRSLPWLGGAIVLFGAWLVLVLTSPLKP